MKYRTVTLTNDFHRTEARVRAKPLQGRYWYVPECAVDRAIGRLCGVPGCACGGLRGPQADPAGLVYDGEGVHGGRVYISAGAK